MFSSGIVSNPKQLKQYLFIISMLYKISKQKVFQFIFLIKRKWKIGKANF